MSAARMGLGLVAGLALACAPSQAQQATVGTPMHAVGDSFYESIGTSWGFNWGNAFFRFGGGGATPSFGGYQPGAGLNTGWYSRGSGWNGYFNLNAAQGSNRSLVSQSPSLTLPNGGWGFFSDTSQSPFVISTIPVVGSGGYGGTFPAVVSLNPAGYAGALPAYAPEVGGPTFVPVTGNPRLDAIRRGAAGQEVFAQEDPAVRRSGPDEDADRRHRSGRELADAAPVAPAGGQASSAARPAPGVAAARRLFEQEQAAKNEEARSLYERGRSAESQGKANVARIYYQNAARRANGPLRDEVLARLRALGEP